MKTDKRIAKENSTRMLITLLIVMLTIVIIAASLIFWFTAKGNALLYQFIFLSSIILLFILSISIAITIFAMKLLWYNKKVPSFIKIIMETFIHISYPFINILGKILKYDKNTIRRAYTQLNNQLVLSGDYSLQGKEILVLTPHCIQISSCPHKITNNINNCKRCGICKVDSLIELQQKYGIHFKIVTGGTLARKIILELKPRAIIAIACERDLLSGLMDVKRIPILAIVNQRPEGPCVNTQVDIVEVEHAILHFIKE
ncbi:hypothetical protein SAMN05660297_00135 [Natronincola peptidivorans]|uniref:DUF116 domain-containing protein n=1 Tax=Natronincola peptidivorans TaxID=426128 RepID=A0A1H9YB39_9FIRM|nr:DUF116 domain-containing protein [Natronincola peptidivorans]SES66069.1 hypothetical protein SAMN05660297_00135 [Natronincola peptidivorans]